MIFSLLPQNLEFFDCFDQAAQNAVRTAELLQEFAGADAQRRRELVGAIKEKEHSGDAVTHETLDRLQKTYLTPIDRDDIHALITEIDDVVDYIDSAAQRIIQFDVKEITPGFADLCKVLLKATRLQEKTVAALRYLKKPKKSPDGADIEKLLIEIHEVENEGDDLHHRLVGELFRSGLDVLDVIKWKELYEIVEDAVDCCEDVANTIRGIVLKNA